MGERGRSGEVGWWLGWRVGGEQRFVYGGSVGGGGGGGGTWFGKSVDSGPIQTCMLRSTLIRSYDYKINGFFIQTFSTHTFKTTKIKMIYFNFILKALKC